MLPAMIRSHLTRRNIMESTCETLSADERAATRSVLVFIHGTWSTGTRWARLEARAVKAVPSPTFTEYFQWSGSNRMWSRADATRHLTTYLELLASQFPNAQLYIVAHSHGGNIAVRAITEELLPRVARVVTMSTPFLVAEQRPRGAALRLRILRASSTLLGCYWAVKAAALWAAPGVWAALASGDTGMPWIPAWIMPELVVSFGAIFLFYHIDNYLAAAAATSARAIGEAPSRSLPLRILRSPIDEASIGLVVLQACAWIPEFVIRKTSALDTWSRYLSRRFRPRWMERAFSKRGPATELNAIYVAVALFMLFTFAINLGAPEAWLTVTTGLIWIPALASMGPPLAGFLAMALLTPLLLILMAAMFFFGGVGMSTAVLERRVTVETAPPGVWTLAQLPPPSPATRGGRHSAAPKDGAAIAQICAWLGEDDRRISKE